MLEIIDTTICGILMISAFSYFVCIGLNKKIKFSSNKLLIVVVLVLHVIVDMIFDDFMKTFLLFIIDIFYCYKLFQISFRKSIYITFLEMLLLIIPEVLELFLITKILKVSMDFCYDSYAGSIIANLFVILLFVVLVYIFRRFLYKVVNVKIETNSKIIIFSVLTFICIIMFFYTLIKEFRFSNNVFLYFVTMIILLVVLFSLIKQTVENNKIMKEYDKLLEFMTTYENEIENQRILRHETKNEFLAIKAKIYDKQENKEIIEYIDEILKEKIIVNQEKYAKFGYLPPNGIKGLCYFKVGEAEQLGIKALINISPKIKKSSIYNLNIKEQRDLGKILGVFLDNAIEASNKSNKKQIGIETYVSKDKEFKMIISNTFNNEINRNKIGRERFTTKGKDRGHGLLLVKHIVDKNNIFEVKTEIVNNLYVQMLTIKNKI